MSVMTVVTMGMASSVSFLLNFKELEEMPYRTFLYYKEKIDEIRDTMNNRKSHADSKS